VSSIQTALFLFAIHVTGGEPPKTETIDYVLAAQDLSMWRKDVNDGNRLTDPGLKKWSRPAQGVTALLVRVKRVDGEVKEIQVFYSRIKNPKITPVREKPFVPDDKDFNYLKKAVEQ
jgi:hypothetical protein